MTVGIVVTVGEYRTFGPHGPAYQVIGLNVSEHVAHVQVLHSGEELERYSLDHLVLDPLA